MGVAFSGEEDELPEHISEGSIPPEISFKFLNSFLFIL